MSVVLLRNPGSTAVPGAFSGGDTASRGREQHTNYTCCCNALCGAHAEELVRQYGQK